MVRYARRWFRALGLATSVAVVAGGCGAAAVKHAASNSPPSTTLHAPTTTLAPTTTPTPTSRQAGNVDGLPVAVPDKVKYCALDVTYTPQTVVVSAATVRSSLIAISPDGSTFTFSSPNGVLADLKTGKVMLLQGTTVGKVTGVSQVEGHLVVRTAAATLTDLVENGHIAFTTPVNFDDGFGFPNGPGAAVTTTGYKEPVTAVPLDRLSARSGGGAVVLTASTRLAEKSGPQAPSASWRGDVKGIGYQIGFTPSAHGLQYSLIICYGWVLGSKNCVRPPAALGLSAQADGVIGRVTEAADIDISHGSVTSSHFGWTSAGGKLHLSWVASLASGAGSAGKAVPAIRIPLGWEMPIPIGGIPFYTKVQFAFLFHIGLAGRNSVLQGQANETLNVNGGGTQTGTSTAAAPGSSGSASDSISPGTSLSPGGGSIVVAFQIPRWGIGFGYQIANVLWYFDVITTVGQLIGGFVTPIQGGCQSFDMQVSAGWQWRMKVGSQLRLTGPRHVLYAPPARKFKLGVGCPSI
jgi:hypothetical protein